MQLMEYPDIILNISVLVPFSFQYQFSKVSIVHDISDESLVIHHRLYKCVICVKTCVFNNKCLLYQ
jgi:hypothetical protein